MKTVCKPKLPETSNVTVISDGCETEAPCHCSRTATSSVENEYASPVDCLTLAQVPESLENPYSEPFVPPHLNKHMEQSMKPTQVLKLRNIKEKSKAHASYETINFQSERARLQENDEDEHSSDDDSVANLLALRQSVSRLSQFCIDSGSARQQLEIQAQRLSNRFSSMFVKKSAESSFGTGMCTATPPNGGLDTVQESLVSPTPSVSGNSSMSLIQKYVAPLTVPNYYSLVCSLMTKQEGKTVATALPLT